MTQGGTWVSDGAIAGIALAGVLAASAAAVVYASLRLPLPTRLPRPGQALRIPLLALSPLAIVAVPLCGGLHAVYRQYLAVVAPENPMTPVTVIGAGIHFIVVIVGHNSNGWRIALPSAVMGALAAPMIFELPLNLLMMTRAHPALPSDPVLYRILFFAPLLLIEVITLSLLTLSPAVRLSRATLWFVAAMLAVFAVGALVRLGYPPAPVPATLNVATKILALIATLSLFVRPRAGSSTGATLRPARAPAASAARTGVT